MIETNIAIGDTNNSFGTIFENGNETSEISVDRLRRAADCVDSDTIVCYFNATGHCVPKMASSSCDVTSTTKCRKSACERTCERAKENGQWTSCSASCGTGRELWRINLDTPDAYLYENCPKGWRLCNSGICLSTIVGSIVLLVAAALMIAAIVIVVLYFRGLKERQQRVYGYSSAASKDGHWLFSQWLPFGGKPEGVVKSVSVDKPSISQSHELTVSDDVFPFPATSPKGNDAKAPVVPPPIAKMDKKTDDRLEKKPTPGKEPILDKKLTPDKKLVMDKKPPLDQKPVLDKKPTLDKKPRRTGTVDTKERKAEKHGKR